MSEGRSSRGEKWSFLSYASRNEVWLKPSKNIGDDNGGKLLLRDNVLLGMSEDVATSFAPRMDNLGVFGTLILYGPMFTKLGDFFMEEFKTLPRIGGRNWDSGDNASVQDSAPLERERRIRRAQEKSDGLIWSVSFLRHCFVVKFGAREVEGGKRWITSMLEAEGSVPKFFGERALLCLR